MAEEQENMTQDRKLDALGYRMGTVESQIRSLGEKADEHNRKLDAMRDGFVGRHEFKEFQAIVSLLASQKDVERLEKRVESLEGSQTWLVRIILGAVVLAVIGTVIITK